MWEIEKRVSIYPYIFAVVKEHPNATKDGYVLEHRIVMENHLGRLLTKDEVVHHKNEIESDNSIENLEVMTHKEHSKYHGLKQGREQVLLRCPYCLTFFVRRRFQTSLAKKRFKLNFCSRSCSSKFYGKKMTYDLSNNIIHIFGTVA